MLGCKGLRGNNPRTARLDFGPFLRIVVLTDDREGKAKLITSAHVRGRCGSIIEKGKQKQRNPVNIGH